MMDWVKFKDSTVGILGMGYIGSNLFKFFNEKRKQYNINIIIITRENFELIKNTFFDYFFNCAGNTGDFRNNFNKTIDSNIALSLQLINYLKIKNSLVHLSSTRIYGFGSNKTSFFNEDYVNCEDHLSIDYIYDGTKKLTESIYWNNINNVSYKIIICRLSNVFGNYLLKELDESTFIKVMIKSKLYNSKLKIKHNYESTKGYIFIEDALNAIVKASYISKKSNIYNICSGNSYSVKDWLKFLKIDNFELSPKPPKLTYSKIDIQKLKKDVDFIPKYNLDNITFQQILNGQ